MANKFDDMRYVILTLFWLTSLSFSAFSQENADSASLLQDKAIIVPDSILNKLAENSELIDSLRTANSVLKGLLKESQRETESKEREITNLQRNIRELKEVTIKRLEASNDTLQRRLISMASNFLYIPYDEYSIEEIAIPAFLSTKGTSAYTQYQNRLPLLKNYKEDIACLINFVNQASKDLSIPLTAMRETKARENLSILSSMPLYIRYSQYDDWENTYLGIQICLIEKCLNSPTENTSKQLDNYKKKLESLLNNN